MKLSAYTDGRDNNMNLIRIMAAYAVLISHSFVLATGNASDEPFSQSLGVTLGSIAVDIFFMASGLLVTGSLMRKQNLREFLLARIRRIFPALMVMLIIVVFIIGPLLTNAPLTDYFHDGATYRYFVKSITLLAGVGKNLPGLFENNPVPQAVNGSLWTLKLEIRMYAILALAWFALHRLMRPSDRSFKIFILIVTGISAVMQFRVCFGLTPYQQTPHLFFMFFSGASIYILKNRIALSYFAFNLSLVFLILSIFYRAAFPMVYTLTLPYLFLFFAFIPAGRIRSFNLVGDYSYGIYIYAFPVQQVIVNCWPTIGVFGVVVFTTIIVLPLAMLSWNLVESPAMRWNMK